MSRTMKRVVNLVSCGIILGNGAVCSSSLLQPFAPLPMAEAWLYVASAVCGLALGMALEEMGPMLLGVCALALMAVLILSGVLVAAAWVNQIPYLDIVLLLAFQQSFVRFLVISALGGLGVFFALLLKLGLGRL